MNVHPPTRRAFLAGTGGLVTAPLAFPIAESLTGAADEAQAAALPARPNFVIILSDDLGWAELGCYGQKLIRTPNIDRLAAQGLRFTNAYSGAPLCAPSRATLLTGLHSGHATVRENPEGGRQHSMTPADVTFGSLLKLAGYRTACIGKWGFGPEVPDQVSHPNARGFGEFFGFIDHKHAHQYWPQYLWHNRTTVTLNRTRYAPTLFLEHAKRFIRRSAASGEPFLLYYPNTLPHAPSDVPGDAGIYRNRPWTRSNRRHAAQVTLLDSHVGELVRTLREAGVADSTVLIFTADNGPHREKGVDPELFDSNGPLRADKRDVYEGGIRIPMVVWSPSLPGRGRVIDEPVAFWDILPTLADLAGMPVPAHLDGRSMRGLLTGGDHEGHEYLFWNRPRKAQALRRGDWKAVRFHPGIAGAGPGGRFELYDLAADLGEKRDVAAEHPDLVAELNALMDASVGPDPRRPYGMHVGGGTTAVAGRPHEVVVHLRNGSDETWTGLRLRMQAPPGWRISGGGPHPSLAPGESAKVVFVVVPPSRGLLPGSSSGRSSGTVPLLATAVFRAGGRRVRFHARRALAVPPDQKI